MSISIDGSGSITGIDQGLNVSGALTFDDVTFLDSIGIVTARSGIHVISGNTGIGTSNPSHKLDVVGNTQLYGTLIVGDNTDISPTANGAGQLQIDANGYTPYIAADGTAMYIGHNSSSRDLRLQTNETDRLVIDGSTGNVGIATDNQLAKFQVAGSSMFGPEGTSQYQGIQLLNGRDSSANVATGFIDFRNNLNIPDGHLFVDHNTDGSSVIILGTTPAGDRTSDRRVERFRINGNGQTQITGVDDQDNLVVKGGGTTFAVHQDDTDGEVSLRAQDGSGNNYTKYMTFFTEGGSGPTERLRITSAGLVGINETPTIAQFQVRSAQLGGTAGNTQEVLRLHSPDVTNNTSYRFTNYRVSNGTSHASSELRFRRHVDVTDMGYFGLGDGYSSIGYGTAEKVRITASSITASSTIEMAQDVRLVSKPNSTWGAGLNIGGNGQATSATHGSMAVTNGNLHLDSRDGSYGVYLNWYGGTTGTYFGNGSSGQRGRIDGSGNLTLSGSYPGSDLRLKENIETITGATDTIKALVGKTFRWKSVAGLDSYRRYGFIAQEVQQVVPDLVKPIGCHYFDANDNLVNNIDPTESDEDREAAGLTRSLTINTEGVTPILVEAMKELIAKVETLETRISTLESN